MAWTSAWLQSLFSKYNIKKNETKRIVLFNNSPIDSKNDDVFDSKIKVNAIRQAITEEKATTIALIGEYGTGKSSLTNLLYKENEDLFEKPSYINLWDCVCKKEKLVINCEEPQEESISDNQSRINSFTKSFLYQLSTSSKQRAFSKYINQRLSKNYGKVSLSSSGSIISIVLIFFALLSFIFYIGFNKINFNIPIFDFSIPNEFFLFITFPCIYFSAKTDNFLFSLWDSQGKIEPTDTDTFEIFKEICEKLKTDKKRLVIIEDLDRTDDALIVTSLLKEIYRFINLLKEDKDKFIFIISLKSEESLVINSTDEGHKEGLNIYSKIFDYSVWIRPLYFENIREIVDTLLEEKLSIDDKNNILPKLYWIMQGHALTIREIKDRLNEVFLLFDSLSQRDNSEPDIQYNKCSAVVYLQRQYPLEFHALISHEKQFAEIVKNYYYALNLPDKSNFANVIEEKISDSFFSNFIEMLKSKDIENDYAMYFFNYPKNAYIMTLEERYVYDAIIHNNYSLSEKQNVQQMITSVINNRKETVIRKALKELMEYGRPYREFVFAFEKIFEIALEIKRDYLLLSLSTFLKENITKKASVLCIAEIYNYNCVKEDSYLGDAIISIHIPLVLEEYKRLKTKDFIEGWRISIIKFFPDCIHKFINLFISNDLPIIDISTLTLLKESKNIFCCLNFNLITQNTFKSYLEYLYTIDFTNENAKLLIKGLLSIPNLSTIPDSYIVLKKLLMKNTLYDDTLFEIIFSGYKQIEDNKSIIDYVQSIDFSKLSDNTLSKLDELITNEITDIRLIKILESKGLYNSAILSRLCINNFDDFNYENSWIKGNIENLGIIINEKNHVWLLLLRDTFISKGFASKIYTLFNEPFDFVTEKELNILTNPEDIYWVTDFSRVTIENYIIFSNYCNSNKLNSNKLYSFLEALFFSDDEGNRIDSKEIINLVLNTIDFKQCKFNTLNVDQQKNAVDIFTSLIELNNVDNAMNFMKTIDCHIDTLDKLIQTNITTENETLLSEYIDCCNAISSTPEIVIDFIALRKINMALIPEITEKLLKKKKYVQYIIGKSLYDNIASYNNKIPLQYYYEAFCISDSYCDLIEGSEIIKMIYDNKLYDNKLNIKRLELFRKYRQPYKLIELNLLALDSTEERKKYIYSISHIDTYEDSLRFIDLIVSEQYIHLFDNDNAFREAVKRKLWEIDPSGKRKPGVLKRIFTNKLERNLSRKTKPII